MFSNRLEECIFELVVHEGIFESRCMYLQLEIFKQFGHNTSRRGNIGWHLYEVWILPSFQAGGSSIKVIELVDEHPRLAYV